MHVRPIPRRGLFFPPRGTPRINESHDAAGLLRAAYLFGARPIEIRPGFGPLSIKTGTPVPAIGPTGAYTSYTAASGHVAVSGPSGDFSVVAVAMRGITAGSAGLTSNVQVIATNVNISASRSGFILALGNSYSATPNRLNVEHYNSNVQIYTGSGWVNGVKQTMASGIGSTDLLNGVWYGVGATYQSVNAGNGALTIADFVDNFFALTGGKQFLAVFDGILPDGLMNELTLNPSDLLRWPEDELQALMMGRPASSPHLATPAPGHITLAGLAPTVRAGATALAGLGSVSWQGRAPSIQAGATARPGFATLSWQGKSALAIGGSIAGLPPAERSYSATLPSRAYAATLPARAYTVTLPPRSYS